MNTTIHSGRNSTLSLAGALAALSGGAQAQCFDQIFGAPDASNYLYFAAALDVNGDWLFAGAAEHANGGIAGAGAVCVHHKVNGAWPQSQILSDTNYPSFAAGFGQSLDSDGEWLAVGVPNFKLIENRDSEGAVLMFRRVGNAWKFNNYILAQGQDLFSYAHFGQSVAMKGNRMAVGSSASNGLVFVYRFTGTNWVLEHRITNPTGSANALFGRSVAIDGLNMLVVGAPGATTAVPNSGAAYVYGFNAGAWGLYRGILRGLGIGQFPLGCQL